MAGWFRMYAEVINDPKAQRLPAETFKAWINILCLACQHEGEIPSDEDIAFALRVDVRKAQKLVKCLVDADLIDVSETGRSPHNWEGRQYKSDVSTGRVKRFRERSKKQDGTLGETPPEAEQKQSRAEADAQTPDSILGCVGEIARAAGVPAVDPGRIAEQNVLVKGWIEAGADRDMILAVVRETLARAATQPKSLRYFDGAVRDRLASKVAAVTEADSLADKILAKQRKAASA